MKKHKYWRFVIWHRFRINIVGWLLTSFHRKIYQKLSNNTLETNINAQNNQKIPQDPKWNVRHSWKFVGLFDALVREKSLHFEGCCRFEISGNTPEDRFWPDSIQELPEKWRNQPVQLCSQFVHTQEPRGLSVWLWRTRLKSPGRILLPQNCQRSCRNF